MRARRSSSAAAKVESIGLDARTLVTIGPDDEFWSVDDKALEYLKGKFAGAIVRLQPPANASEAYIENARRFLAAAGVAAMRFESPAQAAIAVERPRPERHAVPREVVMAMANDRSRHAELRPLLDFELAKVGL